MPIDFFQGACQEIQLNNCLFGICDDQNGLKAYTSLTYNEKWIAKVRNENNKEIVFTAIDNCISIIDENGNMVKRCDGMLTYFENVVFVELKDKNADWISQAVHQLETTIKYFLNTPENILKFTHKRAFACNRQHPRFNYSNVARSQRFFSQYKVRLNIVATIEI